MISVRTNTLKTATKELEQQLKSVFPEVAVSSIDWYSDALLLEGIEKNDLTESSLYKEGLFYLQNLSSMIPALILAPEPGEKVLDMCAAPGSKTTQLAALMKNEGEIIANDASRSRMFKLQALLAQYGATNVTLKNEKGEFLWRKHSVSFDRVLVDAPCSMDQELPGKKIKLLAKQQTFLVRSAMACVKPGGVVVYSTCTSRREENEEVVEWLLKKEENVQIEVIELPGLPRKFFTQEGFIRIPKGDLYESFFVAKLRKM